MMRSKLDDTEIKILPGSGMITVELNPLQLYGGTYLVQVLFRDESDAESIAVGWSSSFYVAGSLLSHQSMNGIYEPFREWRHEPLPGTSTQSSLE
jgi:hypothetical protein